YLIALAFTLAIIMLGALLYAGFMDKPLLESMRWAFIIGIFVLLSVGFVTILPFSEYRYVRGAGINPAIAHEGMKHVKSGRDSKKMGIILGIIGLTLFLIYCIIFF
ncbi:MAG: hypothetical protein QXJ94_03430, partial [Candidatus Bathyarchaeia archaeon]